jgi:phage anti-repressor protein
MTNFDYIELIENNPITKLSNTYNNQLLNKIKEIFSNFEQKLFISSFYCYLNFDKNIDFIINLDNIWKWLGFTQKNNAVLLLEKNFTQEIDYKIITTKIVEENNEKKKNGGQNKKTIMLTIKCFKSLCLKAQTTKSYEIHEYYMKLEEVLQDVIEEETNELRLQLNQKDIIIQNCKKDKQLEVENAIITQFPLNTECIYFGTIDNTNKSAETLIKFGHTNDLSTRVQDHHKKYNNFTLINAFRVQNKVEIEKDTENRNTKRFRCGITENLGGYRIYN